MKHVKSTEPSLFPDEDLGHQYSNAHLHNEAHYNLEYLFLRLAESKFRSKFHLSAADITYIDQKGIDTIHRHAEDLIAKRLAPAVIPNDGKQTPMRGHPVFVAQHATACCCRGCFAKWHGIPAGRELTADEQRYAVAVVMEWVRRQYTTNKIY